MVRDRKESKIKDSSPNEEKNGISSTKLENRESREIFFRELIVLTFHMFNLNKRFHGYNKISNQLTLRNKNGEESQLIKTLSNMEGHIYVKFSLI